MLRAKSDEEFFVRRRGIRLGPPILLPAKHINRNLHAFQNRRRLLNGRPQSPFKFRSGFFDHFQRPRQNMVRANDLHAEPFHRIREHAIDLLRRTASDPRDFRRIAHDAGNSILGIFENPVRTQKNGIHPVLQVRGDSRELLDGSPHLEKHAQQDRHLNHDGNRRYHDERLEPPRHPRLLTAKRTCRADYETYETFDSRLYVSFPASTAAARPSFWRAIISLLRWIKSSARSRSSRALRCAYSRPSSARSLRYSRVSSPDFGAKSRPTIAPMPRPTRKKLAFDPALLSPIFSPPKLTVAQAYRGSKQSANAFRVKNLPYSWFRGTCLMQPRKYPLRLRARKLRGEIFHRQFLEPCDASEFAQQFA